MGSPWAENAQKGVIRIENLHFVFLSKTKLKGREWDNIRRKVHLKNFICVNCAGEGRQRKGGLAIFWSDEVDISLISQSLNHLDFRVRESNGEQWRLIEIFGFPEEENK